MEAPIKDQAEFAELLEFAAQMERPAHYQLMLLLTIDLGLRPVELALMERSWLRGRELRIPAGKSKRGRARTLPVTARVARACEVHMGSREGRVFLNRRGEDMTAAGVSDALRRLYREAGQVGSCYSGRRSLATRLVDEGVNILVVQRVLGHSSPVTTLNYVGVTDGMMRRALGA